MTRPLEIEAAVSKRLAAMNEARFDPKLSAEGRREREAQLRAELMAFAPKALEQMQGERKALVERNAAMEKKRAAVYEKARGKWDYQRLNYELTKAGSLVRGAENARVVSEAYERAVMEADPYRQRALLEVGAAEVTARWPGDGHATVFAHAAPQRLREMLSTPETEAVDGEERDLIDSAREFLGVANRLRPLFAEQAMNPIRTDFSSWAAQRESTQLRANFAMLAPGINVEQKTLPTGEKATSLVITATA